MQLTAVLDYLTSSLAALQVHHRSLKLRFPLSVEIRDLPLGAKRRQLQLWWVNTHERAANEVLWDYCELNDRGATSRLQLARQLKSRGLRYNPDASAARESLPSIPDRAFRFHPMRFQAHYPFAQLLARGEGSENKPVVTKAGRDIAADAMAAVVRQRASALRDRVELPNRREVMHEMLELSLMYGNFYRRGQTIFNLAGELGKFRHTDLGKVLLGALSLPATAFYVHFGPQRHLTLRPGWCVDGAYVARMNRRSRLKFLFTCAPPSPEAYHRSAGIVEPVFVQTWGPDECSVPAASAIDNLLSHRATELRRLQNRAPRGSATSRTQDRVSRRAEELAGLQHRRAVWSKALRLLVASLLYLSGYADDAEDVSMAKRLGYWIPPVGIDAVMERGRARAKRLRLNLSTITWAGKRSRRESSPSTLGPPRRRAKRAK